MKKLVLMFSIALVLSLTFAVTFAGCSGGSVAGGGSRVIMVPRAVATITEAMALATDGDTVFIEPKLYRHSTKTGERFPIQIPTGVTLTGEFWAKVGIECDEPVPAIEVVGDRVKIENLTIASPSGRATAGIVANFVDDLTVEQCNIRTTSGVICIGGSRPTVNRCIIASRQRFTDAGVHLELVEEPTVTQNTIVGYFDGLRLIKSSSATVRENIVDGASVGFSAGLIVERSTLASLANNDVLAHFVSFPPGILRADQGNLSVDPMFVNRNFGDFRLRADSPCATAGPDGGPIGALPVAP